MRALKCEMFIPLILAVRASHGENPGKTGVSDTLSG
jgi:hypothetical protein